MKLPKWTLIRFGALALYTFLVAVFVKSFWDGLFLFGALVGIAFVLGLIEKRWA